jgi:hypothetical protein
VNRVAALLLPLGDLESERCFRNAVNLTNEIPTLIVEEALTIGEQKLQVADLRRVNRRVIDLGYAAVVERVPDSTGGRIGSSDCDLGTPRPPRFNSRSAGSKT